MNATEEKGSRIIPDAAASAHTALTLDALLSVLDGAIIDALFEGMMKKSIDYKQVRSVLDGYDMRAMTFRDATHLMQSASNCRHRLRPQQLKQIHAALRKASGAEITTTGSELVDLAYSLRVYEYDYCDVIKEIIERIAMRLQDSSDKLSGKQVAMALNGLKGMSSEHAEVRSILKALVNKVESCPDLLSGQQVVMALYNYRTKQHNNKITQ